MNRGGYHGKPLFEFCQEQLGYGPNCPTDIHKLWKPSSKRRSTYHSFMTHWRWYELLGWIQRTDIRQPSKFVAGGEDRILWELTAKGANASRDEMANPHRTLYGI